MIRGFVRVIKIHLVRVRLRRRLEHFDFVAFRRRIDVPITPQKRALIKHSHVAIVESSWFLFRVCIYNFIKTQSWFLQRLGVIHVHEIPRRHAAHQAHLEFPFVFPAYPFDWFVVPRVVRAFLVVQVSIVFRRPFGKRSDVEQIVSFQRRNDGVARVRVRCLEYLVQVAHRQRTRPQLLLVCKRHGVVVALKSPFKRSRLRDDHQTRQKDARDREHRDEHALLCRRPPPLPQKGVGFPAVTIIIIIERSPPPFHEQQRLLLLVSYYRRRMQRRRRRRRTILLVQKSRPSFCCARGGKHHRLFVSYE